MIVNLLTYFAPFLVLTGLWAMPADNSLERNWGVEEYPPPQIYWITESFYAPTTKYSKHETCPNRPCITASGRIAEKDYSVACPPGLKLGTKIRIDGREYRCDDRYFSKLSRRVDIFAGDTEKDYQEAIKYGKKVKEIEILK